MHDNSNNNLRSIDYFPCVDPSGLRCSEYRDHGTYTIVFQDGAVGGLEFDVDGKWIQVPADVEAVVSWGWCGAILSNDTVKAAKNRVARTWPALQRRTIGVIFVAPALDVKADGRLREGTSWMASRHFGGQHECWGFQRGYFEEVEET